ncbi:hypothetical protein L7F22_024639 [Adiantum nelumboides]|nr:hypothetical protein [Adiantum nelumboides]
MVIQLADECSKDPRCNFTQSKALKIQRGSFENSSASRMVSRLALELTSRSYGLSASSHASRMVIPLADGCSEDPLCNFTQSKALKTQRGPFEHPSATRMGSRLALELVGKSYGLSYGNTVSSNANRMVIRSFEHLSASCITTRLALEFVGKPYDLPTNFNAIRITKRLADVCSEDPRCVFSALICVKLQRGSFEHPSASGITIRLALELVDNPYDLSASSNTSRITKRLADGCSKGLRCVFSALDTIKLQCGASVHLSASRITIRLALEFAGKPYDLLTSSNANQLIIQFADGCSEGPCCVFSALDCVKLQAGPSQHPSVSRIIIRLVLELIRKPYDLSCFRLRKIATRIALELADKSYDLSASSNANRIIKRLADECSKDPRCVFSALNYVKLQRGSFEHPSANRISIRLPLEIAGKPHDLPSSSNASDLTIRLGDGALDCVKLQCGPFDHSSASRVITIRFTLELVRKTYYLSANFNATRLTIRLAEGCSEDPRCVFSALEYVKLQREAFEHPSASRIIIRLALELVGKPYDLSASSNANRLTIRLANGWSKGPRCVFNALNCLKLQRGSFEHPSASRITIRLALQLAGKPYDLPARSNASRITKPLDNGCLEGPRCVFSALYCVKLQRGPFQHPSVSRITIQLALELAGKSYDLPASHNASRITIRLADGCSKYPRCVFSALDCVKLQRRLFERSSEHISASCITIRLALELVVNPYDLSTSSNAIRIIKRLVDGRSEVPRCVFSTLNCVKLQRGPFEHPSTNRIIIRFALELDGKPYDLSASSNASRITKRLADGCSKGPRCILSPLHCIKLQRRPFEHPSASRITIRLALEIVDKPYDLSASSITSRITIRLALELADKSYDLSASSNASRLTIRLADGCTKGPRCIFSALDCVKLQRRPFEHISASCITIRLALELVGKPYDLSASSNAIRITKRLADGCLEGPRCIFSTLNCVKLQRGPFQHPSAHRIIIHLALELASKPYDLSLADKPYDLPASSNASRLTIRLTDGCSKGPCCVFSALDYVKLQRGAYEHPSARRITIRLTLEIVDKPYDLSASVNASWLTIRLADGCSEAPRCVFSALDCVNLQYGDFEHPSASRITICLALELAGKSYDLPASCNAKRITKRIADGCLKDPRCVFSALNYVKSQCGSSEHLSASRITIRLVLKFAVKPYDLQTSSNASRIIIRLADGCSNVHIAFSVL